MAKSKKAAKKSRREDKKKRPDEAKTEYLPASKPRAKSSLTCDFCNKPMKDLNTKNLHEINCKKKMRMSGELDKSALDSVIQKMKGDFDEQKQQMTAQFEDREQRLEAELKELKEVLRMEIEHRHKELERVSKEAEQKAQPAEMKQPDLPSQQPKAIDMIPVPVPHIPKARVEAAPQPPYMEVVHVGALEPQEQRQETAPAKEPPEEEPAQSIEYSKEELLAMVRTELEPVVNKLKELEGAKPALGTTSDVYAKDLETLASEIEAIKKYQEDEFSKLAEKTGHGHDPEFKRIDREFNKFSERIMEIMDEIGFGESLSVAKIPPTILEIVYQATLDDLNIELIKALGSQDAEKIARLALEEVRLKTSGSELFKFDGRKIVTDSLAKSIEANLISAKQIQTTYDELLARLLENLPQYKAKNFRAMIKVKSQEFAVDRATVLSKEFERINKVLETAEHMIAALSAQISTNNMKLQEELRDIREKWLASKADSLEVEVLRDKLAERDQREATLANEISLIKAHLEMKGAIAEAPSDAEPEVAQSVPVETLEADACVAILDAVSQGASSKTAVMKKTGLDEKIVVDALSKLVADNKVVEVKAGKRVKYMTPGQALEEKLEEHMDSEMAMPEKEKTEEAPIYEIGEPVAEEQESKTSATDTAQTQREWVEAPKPEIESQQIVMEPQPEEKADASMPVHGPLSAEEKKEQAPESESPPPEPEIMPEAEKKEPPQETELPLSTIVAEARKEILAGEKEPLKPPKEKIEPKKKHKKEIKKKETSEKLKKEKPVKPEKKKEILKKENLTPKKEAKQKKPEKKEKAPEEVPEAQKVMKSLDELNEDEKKVLGCITAQGVTVSAIQSKVGKGMKYAALLRALRNLIDYGHVGIVTKGKMTLYQIIRVEKMDKQKTEEKKTEVN